MTKHYRMEQVNELLRQEIGKILVEKVRDPRVGMVTVTAVQTSPDLHHARVYISVLDERKHLDESLEGLKKASGFIRKTLGGRIRLRYLPELTFCYDQSIARGDRVSRLLRRLREDGELGEAGDGDLGLSE